MNTRVLIAVVAVIAVSIAGIAATRTGSSNVEKKAQPVETVSIEDLSAKPLAHLARMRVEGVVASEDKGKGLIVLISPREFKECGMSCTDGSTARVPVRWSLKTGDKVIVEGTVTKDGKGAAFVADMVKKQ